MKKQSGFTLIELIIVIVILGILAVTAAPQFFNFGSDARQSTVRGLEGSIKAASELVHARAQINPGVDAVTVRGSETAQVDEQYAEATEEGIGNALSLGNADWVVVTAAGVDVDNTIAWRPASVSEGTWTLDRSNLTDEAESLGCFAFYYWDPAGAPDATPEIGSVTTDC